MYSLIKFSVVLDTLNNMLWLKDFDILKRKMSMKIVKICQIQRNRKIVVQSVVYSLPTRKVENSRALNLQCRFFLLARLGTYIFYTQCLHNSFASSTLFHSCPLQRVIIFPTNASSSPLMSVDRISSG